MVRKILVVLGILVVVGLVVWGGIATSKYIKLERQLAELENPVAEFSVESCEAPDGQCVLSASKDLGFCAYGSLGSANCMDIEAAPASAEDSELAAQVSELTAAVQLLIEQGGNVIVTEGAEGKLTEIDCNENVIEGYDQQGQVMTVTVASGQGFVWSSDPGWASWNGGEKSEFGDGGYTGYVFNDGETDRVLTVYTPHWSGSHNQVSGCLVEGPKAKVLESALALAEAEHKSGLFSGD